MTEAKTHALLGASGAKRWMACPPSARLTEHMNDESSIYAKEGDLAHEICEVLLKEYAGIIDKKEKTKEMKKLKSRKLYTAEMLKAAEEYLHAIQTYCAELDAKPFIAVEQRVDFSDVVPEGYGTADCIILQGTTMHVLDFKYGAGTPVYAYENPQQMLYAYGALRANQLYYDIQEIKVSIVQPRNTGVSTYELLTDDLVEWANHVVKPLAELADAGQGEYAVGDHCQFCKAAAECRYRAELNTKEVAHLDLSKLPPLLTKEEYKGILIQLNDLLTYKNKLEKHVKTALLNGEDVPGFKLVAGRNSRKFIDDAFTQILAAELYPEALLYERVPVSVAALEKAVGKKEFAQDFSAYVQTVPGTPSMAFEEDKRPAVSLATNDFSEVLKNET